MRTTITLEDDVATRIEQLLRSRKTTLKKLVNEALRLGLERIERPERDRPRYRTEAVEGRARVQDVDDVAGVLSAFEKEGWR